MLERAVALYALALGTLQRHQFKKAIGCWKGLKFFKSTVCILNSQRRSKILLSITYQNMVKSQPMVNPMEDYLPVGIDLCQRRSLVLGTTWKLSPWVLPDLVALLEFLLPILWGELCTMAYKFSKDPELKTDPTFLYDFNAMEIYGNGFTWFPFLCAPLFIKWLPRTSEVFRVGWWMSRYGARSPKRQYAWSNGAAIRKLDVGWRKMKHKTQTVRHYVDANGIKRYHGTLALRHSENLSCAEKQLEMIDQCLGLWTQ